MREICQSGSEGGAAQTMSRRAPPSRLQNLDRDSIRRPVALSLRRETRRIAKHLGVRLKTPLNNQVYGNSAYFTRSDEGYLRIVSRLCPGSQKLLTLFAYCYTTVYT